MKKTLTFTSIAAALLLASSAFAAEAPTITTSVLNSANATTTSATIGTTVHAFAEVATASTTLSTPAGTVDFSLYPNTTCTGVATVLSGVVLSNGVAISGTTSVPGTGLSYKAHYNGQTNVFTPADGACMPVAALSSAVTVGTTLSTTSAQVGATVHDAATLTGVTANAGGTLTYSVFTNTLCSAGLIAAGTKTVTNGVVPNSNDLVFNTAGTYYWQAVYSGDAANSAATSTCTNEVLTISATTTPPVTGPNTIRGVVYNDLNKNGVRDAGETGLSGWTINLFKGTGWWKFGAPVQTVTTTADGSYTFTGVADGTYSVEQVITKGWSQLTDDYDNVVIAGGAGKAGLDFGDVLKNGKGKTPRERKNHFKHHWFGEGKSQSSGKSEKGESEGKSRGHDD